MFSMMLANRSTQVISINFGNSKDLLIFLHSWDVETWPFRSWTDNDFFSLGRKALDYAMDEGHNEIKRIFEKAPTRASWDLQNDIGNLYYINVIYNSC